MKFGLVPLDQAEGAILAHSVALHAGHLRKGTLLGRADLEDLAAAGLSEVTVARLDPDDVDEDAAALRVAEALVPDPAGTGLRLVPVGTGRVNILAEGPGLLRVIVERIHALNAVDPAITLACHTDFMRLDPGALAATVKIISYGVPARAVAQAAEAGRAGLRLQAPVLRHARLIQTRIGADFDPAKGHAVMAARLERLGVTLAPAVSVPHATAPLAAALRAADEDLVLILTGSATSDLQDTAPEALRRAGGTVSHFGMPVDPGNLLFLGALQARPVIGLPGCARSPALNGADWVMERVICGLTPTPAQIMGMGVGGLLKEIPSRPRPRRIGERAAPGKVTPRN